MKVTTKTIVSFEMPEESEKLKRFIREIGKGWVRTFESDYLVKYELSSEEVEE